MKETEQNIVVRTITGEGVEIDLESMTVELAKEKCMENSDGTCLQDFKPCDLGQAGTCHRGRPCIIAEKLRR